MARKLSVAERIARGTRAQHLKRLRAIDEAIRFNRRSAAAKKGAETKRRARAEEDRARKRKNKRARERREVERQRLNLPFPKKERQRRARKWRKLGLDEDEDGLDYRQVVLGYTR